MARIVVALMATTDPKQPEAAAALMLISVHQDVRVERMKTKMRVPTATFADMRLTTAEELGQTLVQSATLMARGLAGIILEASSVDPAGAL